MEALASNASSKTNRLDMLSLLRVFACMIVFFLHAILVSRPGLVQANSPIRFFITPAWAGVWIFFVLSGYLMGKGFFSGKYEISIKGVLKFFWGRFKRIAPLYYFSCLIIILFTAPQMFFDTTNGGLKTIFHLLTFTFDGACMIVDTFNATWYVSTLVALYLLCPFFYLGAKQLAKKKWLLLVGIVVLILVNYLSRNLLYAKAERLASIGFWDRMIYRPFFQNIDSFFGGFLLAGLMKDEKRHRTIYEKIIALSAIVGLIVYNTYIYGYNAIVGNADGYIKIYRYTLPTVYVLVVLFYIYVFDGPKKRPNEALSWNSVRRNPLRILEYFALITFGFYLWHSSVMAMLSAIIPVENHFNRYLVLITSGFIITVIISIFTYYCFERKKRVKKISEPSNNIIV